MGVKGHAGVSQGQARVKLLTNALWSPKCKALLGSRVIMHWSSDVNQIAIVRNAWNQQMWPMLLYLAGKKKYYCLFCYCTNNAQGCSSILSKPQLILLSERLSSQIHVVLIQAGHVCLQIFKFSKISHRITCDFRTTDKKKTKLAWIRCPKLF